MTKALFSTYTPRQNGKRSIEEAISELQREMDTRKRIFDNWVQQGRCSWVDAHDRMERLMTALSLLIRYSNDLEKAPAIVNNEALVEADFLPENALDEQAAERAA